MTRLTMISTKRRFTVLLFYLMIIAAMLFMYFYVQKNYRRDPSSKVLNTALAPSFLSSDTSFCIVRCL